MIIVILIGVILLLGVLAHLAFERYEIVPIFCMLLAIFLLIVTIGLAVRWTANLVQYQSQLYIAQMERLTADNIHKIATFNSKVLAAQQFHSPLWRHIFCSDAYYNFELLPLPTED